ncbi:MAG: hypothetical protein KKB81_01970 [Candidatus Margulisbacteria bacterium]|nr:hypothetical protein [Candidatus Margulisiibacteriota bacterium]MBU1022548.1 hypothetical protein [Candidatus Margulisiibacteriota bacterium]MBU1728834.1 hypothetical protein [Candidatus Margulisiibacteriota bacterium]MBU1955800.1 hypothetical protein [Candidatus Margulisiibacteriota bacterium]
MLRKIIFIVSIILVIFVSACLAASNLTTFEDDDYLITLKYPNGEKYSINKAWEYPLFRKTGINCIKILDQQNKNGFFIYKIADKEDKENLEKHLAAGEPVKTLSVVNEDGSYLKFEKALSLATKDKYTYIIRHDPEIYLISPIGDFPDDTLQEIVKTTNKIDLKDTKRTYFRDGKLYYWYRDKKHIVDFVSDLPTIDCGTWGSKNYALIVDLSQPHLNQSILDFEEYIILPSQPSGIAVLRKSDQKVAEVPFLQLFFDHPKVEKASLEESGDAGAYKNGINFKTIKNDAIFFNIWKFNKGTYSYHEMVWSNPGFLELYSPDAEFEKEGNIVGELEYKLIFKGIEK